MTEKKNRMEKNKAKKRARKKGKESLEEGRKKREERNFALLQVARSAGPGRSPGRQVSPRLPHARPFTA